MTASDVSDFIDGLPPADLAVFCSNLQKQMNLMILPPGPLVACLPPSPMIRATVAETPTFSHTNTESEFTNPICDNPDTFIIARADRLECNFHLLSKCGSGMDDKILRQVKLTPECLKN